MSWQGQKWVGGLQLTKNSCGPKKIVKSAVAPLLMMDSGTTRNLDFRFWKLHWLLLGWRKVEHVFSSLFTKNFAIHIWWFFKAVCAKCATELWKIIKYGKNLAKNEENSCSTCLQSISLNYFVYVPETPFFGHLIRSLGSHHSLRFNRPGTD